LDKVVDNDQNKKGILTWFAFWTAEYRVPVSRFAAVLLVLILLFTKPSLPHTSIWSYILNKLGLILVGISITGRVWTLIFISGYKTRRLITKGPYSFVRHPLYFFSLIGCLGLGFTSVNAVFMISIIAFFAIYYPLVMHFEEAKMLSSHPEEYEAYSQKIPQFFPRKFQLIEPDSYQVVPRKFRRDLINAMCFLVIYVSLDIIYKLHAHDVFPVLF